MPDYSIAVQNVPIGGRAVVNFDTFDADQLSDVDSALVEWYDNNGVLVESLTRTTVDVAGTDIYGNPSTIVDVPGTGTYRATLVIDPTNYTPPEGGLRWSVRITITKAGKVFPALFYFWIVPTTLTITLDSQAISTVVMRQVGILEDVQIVADTVNSNLSLRSGIVYAVVAAYKNGAPITYPTDFVWQAFRSNVALVVPPVVNDHFTFTIQTKSSAFVLDVVNRTIRDVVRALRPHYESVALTTSPSVVEIIKALAIGQLKQDLSQGIAMDSAYYRSGRDLFVEMKMALIRIQRGEEDIYDALEEPLVRKAGSLVGGYHHPDGEITNRLQLLDRLQQYTGLYLSLRPDPILGITRASRSGVVSVG